MLKNVSRIIGTICTIALAKGLLFWLGTKDIHPEQWVAAMIGIVDSAVVNEGILWVLAGLVGLTGLFLGPFLLSAGQRLFTKRSSPADEWPAIAILKERGKLDQQLFQLKAKQPKFPMVKSAIEIIMDGDDIREKEIKKIEQRISELTDMLEQIKRKP